MSKKSEKQFLKEQLEVTEAKIRATDPTDPEYDKLLKRRKKLVEQLDHYKIKIDGMEILTNVVIPLASIGASAAVGVHMAEKYEKIAKMAYGLDEDFKLCNGRVWNLKDKLSSLIPKH